MIPRENKSGAWAGFGGADRECCGIFRNGLLEFLTQRARLARGDKTKNNMALFEVAILWFRYF